jgi:hypothetical protein
MSEILGLLRDLPPPSFALLHHPMTALVALFLLLPVGLHALLCARVALEAAAKPGRGLWIGGAAALGLFVWGPLLVARPDLLWPAGCLAVLTSAIVAGRAARRVPRSLIGPDPTLATEVAAQHRRRQIAQLEAVLATPARTPAETLRHLEARDALARLRARP